MLHTGTLGDARQVGGPAYRIGLGGGAASSRVGDAKTSSLDFDAVQRGDAEMENRLNRLMRACVELGDENPIISIHDQVCGCVSGVVVVRLEYIDRFTYRVIQQNASRSNTGVS